MVANPIQVSSLRLPAKSAGFLLFFSLASCAPEMKLAHPEAIVSEQWNVVDGSNAARTNDALSWSAFGSQELASLIHQAQNANPDIAMAAARIMQARADVRLAKAARGPTLDFSVDGSSDIRNLRGQTDSFDRIGSAEFAVSYDIDLFGRSKATQKAAWENMRATGFDRLATELTIEAEVATIYVEIAALDDQISLARRSLENATKLENFIRLRADEGMADPVELGLQAAEINGIEVDLSRLTEARSIAQNGLAVLLGLEAPQYRIKPLAINQINVPAFNSSQPTDLMLRRPDILAAESRIKAENGNVGAARAAFFPSIGLSAGSFLDFATGGFSTPGGALSANLLSIIFDSGRRKADFMRAEGQQYEAVANYRKTTLTALSEAQNAMASNLESEQRLSKLEYSRTLVQRTAFGARSRYLEGSAGVNIVIEAERNLLNLEATLIQTKKERLLAAIALFKALGGDPAARLGYEY